MFSSYCGRILAKHATCVHHASEKNLKCFSRSGVKVEVIGNSLTASKFSGFSECMCTNV